MMMKKGKGHFMYKNNYGCMRNKIMKIVEGRLLKDIDVSAETFNSLIEDEVNEIEKSLEWFVIGTGKADREGFLTNPTDMEITSSGFPIDNPTFTSNSPCTFDYDPYYTDGTGPQTPAPPQPAIIREGWARKINYCKNYTHKRPEPKDEPPERRNK